MQAQRIFGLLWTQKIAKALFEIPLDIFSKTECLLITETIENNFSNHKNTQKSTKQLLLEKIQEFVKVSVKVSERVEEFC